MSAWVRWLLTWLVALALPVQGAAAATMLHCQPAHHGTQAARHVDAPQHAAAAQPHRHPHAAASHADKITQLAKAGCSACAACCVGAAMTVPTLDVPTPPAASALLHAADDAPRAGPAPGVLERPPRPCLA